MFFFFHISLDIINKMRCKFEKIQMNKKNLTRTLKKKTIVENP